MRRIEIVLVIGLVSLLAIADITIAQQPLPAPVLPEEPSQAPVDGGLGILAAAGGAYALKKLRDRQKA
ncbi:PID-CTERM protein-sorting domain-containing protein [Halalkalibaculum sp. DA3122]|uniref:PID-CTERM protein-sorting domain-containing protein n=1 Tax=unclassified Halalkalibaculum TaxID=2964617 RepID=UPI0037544ECE